MNFSTATFLIIFIVILNRLTINGHTLGIFTNFISLFAGTWLSVCLISSELRRRSITCQTPIYRIVKTCLTSFITWNTTQRWVIFSVALYTNTCIIGTRVLSEVCITTWGTAFISYICTSDTRGITSYLCIKKSTSTECNTILGKSICTNANVGFQTSLLCSITSRAAYISRISTSSAGVMTSWWYD